MSALQGFVVRTDVGGEPNWLRLVANGRLGVVFDTTEDARCAHVFTDRERAETQAWLWSDVPGVWRVTVRPATVLMLSCAAIECTPCVIGTGIFTLRINGNCVLAVVDGGRR